jgi:hypothetical protein
LEATHTIARTGRDQEKQRQQQQSYPQQTKCSRAALLIDIPGLGHQSEKGPAEEPPSSIRGLGHPSPLHPDRRGAVAEAKEDSRKGSVKNIQCGPLL